jgi:glycosyl-4,4'-diaponeurosporenoate acyltransferase
MTALVGMVDVRVVDLGNAVTVALDVLAWATVHVVVGYAAHRVPSGALQRDRGILRLRTWERGGSRYERMRIRRWKDRLPEAGAFFAGGISKRHLPAFDERGLATFAAETRRAELAHWGALAALPLFALFNPPFAMPLMTLYAVAANLPCIAVQRYNRARLTRILDRASARASDRVGHGTRVDAAARRRNAGRTIGSSMP